MIGPARIYALAGDFYHSIPQRRLDSRAANPRGRTHRAAIALHYAAARPDTEDVQMPPGTRQPFVDRLIGRATGRAIQPLGGVVDLEGDHAFRRAEVEADHAPRRAEPEGLSEESFHRRSLPAQPRSCKNRSAVNHSIRERAAFLQGVIT